MKGLIALCLLSLLSGCNRPNALRATFFGRQVQFTDAKHGTGCFNYFAVANGSGTPVWEMTGPHSKEPCANTLPITYGVLPPGMKQLTPPAQLIIGQGYSIVGSDGSSYHGYFKLRHVVRIDNDPEAGERNLFQGPITQGKLVPGGAGRSGSLLPK